MGSETTSLTTIPPAPPPHPHPYTSCTQSLINAWVKSGGSSWPVGADEPGDSVPLQGLAAQPGLGPPELTSHAQARGVRIISVVMQEPEVANQGNQG